MAADSLPSHQKPLQPLCCESHYLPGNPNLNRKPWNPLLPPAEFTELYKELSSSVIRRMSIPSEQEHLGMNGSHYSRYLTPADNNMDVLDSRVESLVDVREDNCTSVNRNHSNSLSWQTGRSNGSNGGRQYVFDSTATGVEGGEKNLDGEQTKGGGNKKEKGESEATNSSSQQSGGSGGSGGSSGDSRSGGRAGNRNSGSSDSGGDDGDEDDKKKRGGFGRREDRGGAGSGSSKEPPTTKKSSKQQEEDDEATDSADEGGGEEDTPNSMVMDCHSPPLPPSTSNRRSGSEGVSDSNNARPATQFSGNFIVGGISDGGGGTNSGRGSHIATSSSNTSISATNQFEGESGHEDSPPPLHPPHTLRGATPPHHHGGVSGGRSGTIAVESLAPMEINMVEPSSSTVSMIVGYGVPAASAPPQGSDSKSLPGSELGTPTLDSPPSLTEEKTVISLANPMTTTPLLSPALSLLPQVCVIDENILRCPSV